MERVATNGLKKSRKMLRSSIADFYNKIGTNRTFGHVRFCGLY